MNSWKFKTAHSNGTNLLYYLLMCVGASIVEISLNFKRESRSTIGGWAKVAVSQMDYSRRYLAVYERCKDEYGNLCFISRGFGTEQEHLSIENNNEREEIKARVRELSAKEMTQAAIANQLGISQSKVSRLLKE